MPCPHPLTGLRLYCRKCWYVLDGLTEHRCPECGRTFDPSKRRTYRTKPRGRWWIRVCVRFAAVACFLAALVAVTAWSYRRTVSEHSEHEAAYQLYRAGFVVGTRRLCPAWLERLAFQTGLPSFFVVTFVMNLSANDEDLRELLELKHVSEVNLSSSRVTDAGLVHLARLKSLKILRLTGTNVTDQGLTYLAAMTGLKELNLEVTQVTTNGLRKLRRALPNCEITGPQEW